MTYTRPSLYTITLFLLSHLITLQAMNKEILTPEQDALKITIESYRDVPYRASQKRLVGLHKSINTLFRNHPHNHRYLRDSLFFTEADKHSINLEATNPDRDKCAQALAFFAKVCYCNTLKNCSLDVSYGIAKIQAARATFLYALSYDETFEKTIYNDQLSISDYNNAFTPPLYSKNAALIKTIHMHAQEKIYVPFDQLSEWMSDINEHFSLKPHLESSQKLIVLQELTTIKNRQLREQKEKLSNALAILIEKPINKDFIDALNLLSNSEKDGTLSLYDDIESKFLTWKKNNFQACC